MAPDKSRNFTHNSVTHIVSRYGSRIRVFAIEGGPSTPLRTVKDTDMGSVADAKRFMANPVL